MHAMRYANRHKLKVTVFVAFGFLAATAHAATKVAVIDDSINPLGAFWCSFLNNNGYECTLFPASGPTQTVDQFSVIINMSSQWSDSQHELVSFLQSGKGVITWGSAPFALGIDSDPIVQGWIGANIASWGTGEYWTTAPDSILGSQPPGTFLGGVGDFGHRALDDTGAHPQTKVLVRFNSGMSTIALLRNRWEGGRSIYFSNAFSPAAPDHADIILRAMSELSVQIPTTSTWGLLIFGLGILTVGTAIGRARFETERSGPDVRGQIR